jgi:hypothetical protein
MGLDRAFDGRGKAMAVRIVQRWFWGGAGSLAANLALLALMLWSLRGLPPPLEGQVVELELMRPFPPPPLRFPNPKRGASGALPGRTPVIPSSPPRIEAPPADPRTPPAPAQTEPARPDAVRSTLRAALGCQHADFLSLSSDERRRCQAQMASRTNAPPIPLDLDPRGLGLSDGDPEPYLNRRPTNGCKVRAAGDETPMGAEGVASGVACGWSF